MPKLSKEKKRKCEPGFRNLGLRIFHVKDPDQIRYLIGEQDVELKCCHPCVEPVIRNFKTLLEFITPGQETKALKEMEEIYKRFPNNLNILGNLAFMYNERKYHDKLDQIYKDMEEIKKTNDTEVGRCLAEQGYILMIDLHSETSHGPEETLNKFQMQIEEMLKFPSVFDRRNNEEILKHVTLIKKLLHCSRTNCQRNTIQEKRHAMKKLHRGIVVFERAQDKDPSSQLHTEITVWRHYLGKAYIRITGGGDEITSKMEKRRYVKEAIMCFSEVVKNFDTEGANQQETRLVNRTYAYLAYISQQNQQNIQRNESLKNIKVRGMPLGNIQPLELVQMTKNDACPDRVVLNKIGQVYILKNDFDEGEKYFLRSVETCQKFNWFPFSWLCYLYLNRHIDAFKREKETNKSIRFLKTDDIKKAEEYGKRCLEMRKTTLTLYRVAKVYKYMEKWDEATEYLHMALKGHECEKHPELYALLANCLYEKGQMENAIHLMKIALTIEPKNLNEPINFRDLMTYLLDKFRKDKTEIKGKKWKTTKENQSLEIICIMEEGYRKHGGRIKYQLIGVINNYPNEIMDVIQIYFKTRQIEKKELMDMCTGALRKSHHQQVRKRIDEIERLRKRDIKHLSTSETNDASGIREPPSDTPTESITVENPYDFYVLFPPSVKYWVENYFYDLIGRDSISSEIILRGRLYKPGDKKEVIVKRCCRFVVIVNPDFKKDPQIKRLAQELNQCCIDKPTENKIIPVLRDGGKLPDFLSILEPWCFDSDDVFKIQNAILNTNVCTSKFNTDDSDFEASDDDDSNFETDKPDEELYSRNEGSSSTNVSKYDDRSNTEQQCNDPNMMETDDLQSSESSATATRNTLDISNKNDEEKRETDIEQNTIDPEVSNKSDVSSETTVGDTNNTKREINQDITTPNHIKDWAAASDLSPNDFGINEEADEKK